MAEAKDLQKGSYFMHSGELLRVNRKEVIAVGTHSHTKLKLFVQGLMSKGEKAINLHHTDKIEIVDIIRKSAQVISKTNNKVQIMDPVSYETLDANADEELLYELNEGDEVTFIDNNGAVQILEKR